MIKGKLMRLDRPQAKFCLKLDLNCLLIDFFDSILASRFTRRDRQFNSNSTRIRLKSLILIENG